MEHFDAVGIGFGPSNIALAIALDELDANITMQFFEHAKCSRWQPNMLLAGSDIQNNPLRDLITPTNPCSQYTFTNYLKESGRLFDYLNLGLQYPLRTEYSKYIEWVATHFGHLVTYECEVRKISIEATRTLTPRWRIEKNQGSYTASSVVLATGRSVNIPPEFSNHLGDHVFHLTDFLSHIDSLQKHGIRSIGVLGASQSAAEILLDLMTRFPELEIHSIHRGFSIRQKDTSPFSNHVYFPEFIDYYFDLPDVSKVALREQLRQTNYSSSDIDVIHQLYVKIYAEKLEKRHRFHWHNNTVVRSVVSNNGEVFLDVQEIHLKKSSTINVDAVVLATGFKDIGSTANCEPYPQLLADIVSELGTDEAGALVVHRDYSVSAPEGLGLYLNGLCESSHGMGDAGSFSLLSIRAAEIAKSMARRLEHPHMA